MQPGETYNLADIQWRIRNGAAITPQELASLIANDIPTRFAWMVYNNPANVNHTLRHDNGIGNLPFAPDVKSLLAQLELLDSQGNEAVLQEVIDNFSFNASAGNWTSGPDLVQALKQQGVLR